MNPRPELTMTLDDHRAGLTEVSFLLEIFASTVSQLMGGATASVGRIAGRHFARKLPVTLVDPTLEQTVQAFADQVRKGTDISFTSTGTGIDLAFGRCAMRNVCRSRNAELGGDVCRLYHMFIDGAINELYAKPAKSTITQVGDVCHARMEVRQ
ncbi:MAG: hypothetical protein WCP29_10195 [Acidobacteriota bacterium]